MNKLIIFFFLGSCFFYATPSFSQGRIPVEITIDSSFGNNGRIETNIGAVNCEPMAFTVVYANKSTIVCGKISGAVPGAYHLGMIRVDSTGKLDPAFGAGGIVDAVWGESDYPNSMQLYSDNSDMTILAGAAGLNNSMLPSLYRIKANGTPDSTFGTAGRLVMPFDDHSKGEAMHVDISFEQYKVSGKSTALDASGKTGFAVMSLNWDGTLDSTFGVNGRMVLPALVHSVQGFFLNDRRFFFCGISDTGAKELIIGRFTENGVPDSAVGVNGLLHTGIIVSGDTLMAQLEGDLKMLIMLPTAQSSSTHLTIRRFSARGVPDSTYGINGIGSNDITPRFEPKGFIIANDYSEIVSGMTLDEPRHSIYLRITDTTARPDPVFNHTGIISVDVDGGEAPNYLKFVYPIGKLDQFGAVKRFIGVGASIRNGISEFMVARFIGRQKSGVSESLPDNGMRLSIFPNPAATSLTIESNDEFIRHIRIIDALGRDTPLPSPGSRFATGISTYTLDASKMAEGIYYCIAQTGTNQFVQKFVIRH